MSVFSGGGVIGWTERPKEEHSAARLAWDHFRADDWIKKMWLSGDYWACERANGITEHVRRDVILNRLRDAGSRQKDD